MTTEGILRIHMTGAEWFGSRAGGLNRYFESLFLALSKRTDVDVTAQAFGDPPADAGQTAASWGPTGGSTLQRVRASRRSSNLPAETILDRHFGLYGPAAGEATLVAHFQGPWAAESAIAGDNWMHHKFKYIVERMAYRPVETFIVLCEEFRDILRENYGVDDLKINVIPPGVDLARFQMAAVPTLSTPMVLCVRRLERRMGIHVLLRAWQQVSDIHPEAKLVIVGTGTEERTLRQMASDLGVDSVVQFAGRVSDEQLMGYYSRSLFTVVPTIALEGFGLIALESLATGRAPIVSRCGGLPDAVSGLDTSLIVEPGNEIALAERISQALNGGLPSANACRAHAETFSWDIIAQRHVDLYRRLVRS